MKYELDMHTHTIASGHAYSTVAEMIQGAAEKGLKAIGITEHAPKMPGTCDAIYFMNLKVIPREQKGMKIYMGAELNIVDYDGTVDLSKRYLDCLDFAIASMHMPCLKPGTMEQNTAAMIEAMKNPYVKIMGHPDDGRYPLDYEALVKAAKKYHKLLEVNNNSLNPNGFRDNTVENCTVMLEYCKQYQVPVILDSDAHVVFDVARHDFSDLLIGKLNFPEKLIINTSVDKWVKYLEETK